MSPQGIVNILTDATNAMIFVRVRFRGVVRRRG